MARHTGGGNTRGQRAGFGSIRRLPSGRYQARYTGPDGIEHLGPTTFQARADAQAFLALRQSEIIRDEWKPAQEKAQKSLLTFGDFANDWLRHAQLKPRTRADYQRILDRFLIPVFGDRPVVEITRSSVRAWYCTLPAGTPTMRAHAYALLRNILNSAVAEEMITVNPAYIRGAGNTVRAKEPRPASIDELSTITESMPYRYQLMTLLAAWCALRFGELAELRVKDIDLRRQVVHVRRAVVRVDGAPVVGTPKTRAGRRDVTIPPHLLPAVRSHLSSVGDDPEVLLFPAGDGVSALNHSTLYKVFYPARSKAGRPDLRFHDLRHTGAVLAAQTGATLAELMARLGHSTPGAALRYQHAADGRDSRLAAELSRLAQPDRPGPLGSGHSVIVGFSHATNTRPASS